MIKGNLLYGQSGGPTAVINASLYGVIKEAMNSNEIDKVYGAIHGIDGILNEKFYDFNSNQEEIEKLPYTPGAFLGSVRHRLKDYEKDESEYIKILEVFKKYNIRYFFYNGGNDSMDTCNKISKYLSLKNYECKVIGIPKTIDNDLPLVSHTPGYGSAAKYLINTIMELVLDTNVYKKGRVTIVEVMGRDTGWLTASSVVAKAKLGKPHLIYVPERAFNMDVFLKNINDIYQKEHKVFVVVSEGIRDKNGKEVGASDDLDAFGHVQMGGVANYLANIVKNKLGISTRSIEINLLQRCAGHYASKTDVNEAIEVGRHAVSFALAGESDIMVGINVKSYQNYEVEYIKVPLGDVANKIKYLDDKYIASDSMISSEFLSYVLPLIKGENEVKYDEDGVIDFAKR